MITDEHIKEFADKVFKVRIIHKTLTNIGVNLMYMPKDLTSHINKVPFFRNRVKTCIPILCKTPFQSDAVYLPNELVETINSYVNTFITWIQYRTKMIWVINAHELINSRTNDVIHTNGISDFTYRRYYTDFIKNMYDETKIINQVECMVLTEYVRYL